MVSEKCLSTSDLYREYLKEVDELAKKHKWTAMNILALQLAASFECNKMSYKELKEDLIKKSIEDARGVF
jgi:hypothetical protein